MEKDIDGDLEIEAKERVKLKFSKSWWVTTNKKNMRDCNPTVEKGKISF